MKARPSPRIVWEDNGEDLRTVNVCNLKVERQEREKVLDILNQDDGEEEFLGFVSD